MNISKQEQRVLHVLAQGGLIRHERAGNGKITNVTCFTRDGYVLSDCTFGVFQKLLKRRFVKSMDGKPYRITRFGREAVRPQLDNR